MIADAERAATRNAWPQEFADGARAGLLCRFGYPQGFHEWPLARRNAWWAGFNRGNQDRLLLIKERAAK